MEIANDLFDLFAVNPGPSHARRTSDDWGSFESSKPPTSLTGAMGQLSMGQLSMGQLSMGQPASASPYVTSVQVPYSVPYAAHNPYVQHVHNANEVRVNNPYPTQSQQQQWSSFAGPMPHGPHGYPMPQAGGMHMGGMGAMGGMGGMMGAASPRGMIGAASPKDIMDMFGPTPVHRDPFDPFANLKGTR